MYIPAHFAADEHTIADLLADLGAATGDGLAATFPPLLHDPDRGRRGALLGRVARTNDQWRRAPHDGALVIAHGTDGYVTPS